MKFMVIGLPRSMTTWAANWLSRSDFTVVHDPLYRAHYTEWGGRFQAVSCTGIWRWSRWVNAQDCRKLVLRRPEADVISSIKKMGAAMHVPIQGGEATLDQIQGSDVWHTPSVDLLKASTAKPIWEWLHPDVPFDAFRHDEMTRWKVEPQLSAATGSDNDLLARLLLELQMKDGAQCLGQ